MLSVVMRPKLRLTRDRRPKRDSDHFLHIRHRIQKLQKRHQREFVGNDKIFFEHRLYHILIAVNCKNTGFVTADIFLCTPSNMCIFPLSWNLLYFLLCLLLFFNVTKQKLFLYFILQLDFVRSNKYFYLRFGNFVTGCMNQAACKDVLCPKAAIFFLIPKRMKTPSLEDVESTLQTCRDVFYIVQQWSFHPFNNH